MAKIAPRPLAAKPATTGSVKVTSAKGRPMLTWVGKRPLRSVTAFPAQEVERFAVDGPVADHIDWSDWPERYPQAGLLFHGDNKEVLAHLLANGFRGKVDLVYIDPPFDSGADYVRRVELRGVSGTARLDGEGYTLGEQLQYTDIWANDNYLQFMYERLLLLKELLATDGAAYVHSDARRVHQLRLVMDEVFSAEAFRNQIAWRRTSSHGGANRFGSVTDYILFYAKGESYWFQQHQAMTKEHLDRHYRHHDARGTYALGELTAPGTRRGPTGSPWRGFDVTALGRHWSTVPTELDRLDADGLIHWPERKTSWPRLKRYLADSAGRPITDFWDDLDPINMVGLEREDYPTQKPEALIERIIRASSWTGAIVLDCFVGSGTTSAVAQRLGRRWIACDINKGAIHTTSNRLIEVIHTQSSDPQAHLPLEPVELRPASLAFLHYRVNDYDLHVRHDEVLRLVIEHLCVARAATDRFFDGTLGKKLVKVVPFDHAIGPLDLDEIAKELRARPKEDRDVVVVGIGKELACDPWLADHNRRGAPNHVAVIELRSDPKYGKFFTHQAPKAKVSVRRNGSKAVVEIKDFVSPTIVERLSAQEGIVSPKITDWRSMVDSVMIDANYDGRVFDITVADVPERKHDLVKGTYEVDIRAAKGKATIAVKITDMLGEELLVTNEV